MHLFVYGSLKQNEFNHTRYNFNEVATFLGKAVAKGLSIIETYGIPYPHAIQDNKGEAVGELYDIDLNSRDGLELFQRLHAMEHSAGYYLTFIDDVTDEHGQKRDAAVFVAEEWKRNNIAAHNPVVVREWFGEKNEAA